MLAVALLLAADPLPKPTTWTVAGVERQAIVIRPTKPTAHPPLVFVFHGHGGTMRNAAEKFAYHTHWPEAVVVYPQGLNTPGKFDPDGTRPGWQKAAGEQADRDLKFFDAMLASLKADHKIDDRRVYASGHSNGGGFTYTLWANRGDVLAAVGPSAAGPGAEFRKLTPKPVIHVAGEKDTTVPFETQQRMIARLRDLNGCDPTGKAGARYVTEYASKGGTPVATVITPGDHKFPAAAPAAVVAFFQRHQKPAK